MRPEEARSRRYIRHALTLHYYYSLALGIIALRYDFRARRFTRAPLLQAYALLVNAFVVAMAPLVLHYGMQVMQFYGNNRLMRLMHHVNVYVRSAVVTLTLLMRWQRERRAAAIVEQLLAMEAEYFAAIAVPPRIQRRFARLFGVKYCSNVLQTLAVVYTFTRMAHLESLWTLLLYLYILSVGNVLLGVVFHYFVALWHVCKRFCILNAQLAALFRKLKRGVRKSGARSAAEARLLAAELLTIARLHYRLTQLVLQLNDIYKYQIVGMLLTQILNNTTSYAMMLSAASSDTTSLHAMSYFDRLLGVALFAIILLDMFLLDVIFDAIALATQETAARLRRFHEFDRLETAVAEQCQLLSQQLMLQQLRIEVCGMFVLSKQSAFLIFGATIKQIFILVQFNLEKRFG